VSRFVDRGAVIGAFVGVGMAATIAISFLLVVPIEPLYWLLALPAGLVIGYYANSRSGRVRGAWRRLLPNALVAGAVTGLTFAALLLAVKALFFFGDGGYPDFNRLDEATGATVPPTCETGGDCVYRRYLAEEPAVLSAAGVTDAASFASLYWSQQWSGAASLLLFATLAGLGGGFAFGVAGPTGAFPARRIPAAS
jgi:hypothetical protein